MKNFHACNDFFKIIIDINIIVLCITSAKYNNIGIYKRWLGNLDWLKRIFGLENPNLNPFKVQKLQNQVT